MAHTWMGVDVTVLLGATILLSITAYFLLGGADFGGGIWDLLAIGPRKGAQREAIAKAIGPVWEANHIWLILLIVILFTAFPRAYEALSIALFTPFHLLLIGIVLRGAAFVFRANSTIHSFGRQAWASVFGAASAFTPVLLGATVGAISSGGIRLIQGQVTVDPMLAWFTPVSLVIGLLTLALCAYLAAIYLLLETKGALQEDYRVRALGTGAVVAALALLLLPLIANRTPLLWAHLSRPSSIPPMLTGAILAVLSALAVFKRHYPLARLLAVLEVIILIWGWAFAQWPYLIYPDVTLYNAIAPLPTIRFLLGALPFGFALLIPSLWYLFRVFKSAEQ